MALLLGIPLTITTLSTSFKVVKTLASGGRIVFSTYGTAKSGVNNVKSDMSYDMSNRISNLVLHLESLDLHILNLNILNDFTNILQESLEWSNKYKCTNFLLKIFKSKTYKQKFDEYHDIITRYFNDINYTCKNDRRIYMIKLNQEYNVDLSPNLSNIFKDFDNNIVLKIFENEYDENNTYELDMIDMFEFLL